MSSGDNVLQERQKNSSVFLIKPFYSGYNIKKMGKKSEFSHRSSCFSKMGYV